MSSKSGRSDRIDQVVVFRKLGGPEVLTLETPIDRSLAGGEVRIRVHAFALNRADLMFIRGEHYTIPVFPSRIGSEAVGTVIETGEGVNSFRVGDRVSAIPFFTATHGVQGTTAVLPAEYLTLAPGNLSDAHACALWMQYLTPYFAFREVARLEAGAAVLITAGASSAGLGALQLARVLGLRTIATTRSPAKVGVLLEAGADRVVTDLKELGGVIGGMTAGEGLAAAFDPLGGDSLATYVDHLAPEAVVFGYGTLTDRQPVVPVAAMCRARAVFHPYSMFNHVGDAAQRARGISVILDAIKRGELSPRVDRVFALDDIVSAYRYMESNEQCGKIVVSVSE
jgi:NADPH:quinone reductase-like Zn-dependent oxidoreductase